MVYKIIHGYIAIPPEPPYLFPATRTTRRHSQYQQHRFRTTYFMNSFFPSATCLWNQLPVSVTAISYPRSVSESTSRGDSLTTHYVAEQQDCFLFAPVWHFVGIFCIGLAHIHILCTWQYSAAQQYDNTLHQRDVLPLEEEEEEEKLTLSQPARRTKKYTL